MNHPMLGCCLGGVLLMVGFLVGACSMVMFL